MGVTCFRLYERDIPEYPCIADWYDGEAVVWLYDRKRDETQAQRDAFQARVLAEVGEGLDLDPDRIFLKKRQRQRGLDQYERLDQRGAVRVVEEAGLKFEVNLSDYLDTGLFLDHRVTRGRVRDRAAGKRVLNLFAYTGSFTCYAVQGGAAATTTVDMSRTYCDWAERNLKLNGFSESESHRIVHADCLQFLAEKPEPYDLIVCDPPSFSNSKRMALDSFAVDRDHPMLIAACAEWLAPGGTLYFSSNSRSLRLEADRRPSELEVREISRQTVPEDFRNRKIHRCWEMTKS
jgi:23S rRNA (cytosine1962-C5)-methyltransferase